MKRVVKTIIKVALALVLVGAILVGVSFALGMRPWELWQGLENATWPFSNIGFINYTGMRDWQNEYNEDGVYSVSAAGIKSLDLVWIAGNAEITAYDGDEIRFEETASGNISKENALRWGIDGQKLCIQYCKSGSYRNVESKSIKVLVPAQLAASMEKLGFDGSSADLQVSGLTAAEVNIDGVSSTMRFDGDFNRLNADSASGKIVIISRSGAELVDASSVSGDVEVYGNITSAEADTTSGKVTFDGDFDDIDISTVSGKVTVNGAFFDANIDTSSGSVSLESTKQIREIDVDTVSGGVTLYLPADGGFTVEYDTVSGDLRSNMSASQILKRDKVVYGDGSASINISTTSGNLDINGQ